MLGWHALGPPLIGSDPDLIDPERLGQIVLGQTQGTTLPPDPPADMPIDWRHDAFSTRA